MSEDEKTRTFLCEMNTLITELEVKADSLKARLKEVKDAEASLDLRIKCGKAFIEAYKRKYNV
jgi:hypothetical protein